MSLGSSTTINLLAAQHYASVISSAGLVGISGYAAFLSYGALWAPTYVGIVSAFLVVVGLYGFRALRHGETHTYAYGSVMFNLLIALLVCLGLTQINVNTGKEFVEDNWYLLQNKVIPFTTELDTKRGISSNCLWVLYIGIVTFILNVPLVVRAWLHIGGVSRSDRTRMFVPQAIALAVVALATLGVSLVSIVPTEYASPHGPAAMVTCAIAAVSLLLVAIAMLTLIARKPRSGAYALTSMLVAPFAIITLVASIMLIMQGAAVRGFVTERWDVIQQMLPPKYQPLSKDKYITDTQLLFSVVGWLGMCLFVLAAVFSAMSLAVAKHIGSKPTAPAKDSPAAASYTTPKAAGVRDAEHVAATPPPPGRNNVALRPKVPGTGAGGGTAVTVGMGLDEDVATAGSTPAAVADTPDTYLMSGAAATPITRTTMCHDVRHVVKSSPCWCLIVSIIMAVLLGAVVTIMIFSVNDAKCGAVVRGAVLSKSYNVSFFTDANSVSSIRVRHTFPRGSSVVLLPTSNVGIEVHLEVFGLTDADITLGQGGLPTLEAMTDYNATEHTLDVQLLEPAGYDSASKCQAFKLTIVMPSDSFAVSVDSTTTSAMNNVTARLFGEIPHFNQLQMESTTGPVVVHGVSALGNAIIHSDGGRVSVDSLVGSVVDISTTNAPIVAKNLTSFDFLTSGFGNVTLINSGTGDIIITDVFTAWNATFTTEMGDVIGVIAGVVLEDHLAITTTSGSVYMDDFIMASGASAAITTVSGGIKLAAFTCNYLLIDSQTGSVSLYEVFMGTPQGTSPIHYPNPGLKVNTQSGSVSALGIGSTPTSTTFADELKLDFFSKQGTIKVEVNGGGFGGNYTVSTNSGAIETSVAGETAAANGQVAYGTGLVQVHSDDGDVELAFLPGPLGNY